MLSQTGTAFGAGGQELGAGPAATWLCDLGQVTLTFRLVSSPVSQALHLVILKLLWVTSFPLARITLV